MTRTEKLLTWIYRISGFFMLICFISYLIKLFISPEGLLPWVVTVSVICIVLIPAFLRRHLKRLLRRAYLPLLALMCAGTVFYTVSFSALVGYIYLSPSDKLPDTGECIYIVFGAKINGTTPSKTLASRLETVVQAMEADPDGICIVSGGQGADEIMSEGECMRGYLISRGVDSARIYAETEARNTVENIRFSMDLLLQLGQQDRQIVCISSDTHIPRIRLLCEREGIDAAFVKAPTPVEAHLFANLVREYLSYAKMLLTG